MKDYLIEHAVQNVWCNPEQDHQYIFEAHKISKPLGEENRFNLMGRRVELPVKNKKFHVFQIGHLAPVILGLLPKKPLWSVEGWVGFKDTINKNQVFINLYTAKGHVIPRYQGYYMFSNERDLIFIVEIDKKVKVSYENEAIFLRVYNNAYFQSQRSNHLTEALYNTGKSNVNSADILALQAQYNTYKNKPGHVFAYVNGYLVDRIDPINVLVGDTVEFVYDSSVKRLVTFTVNDLLTFTSILDSKQKYLLHYASGDNATIDYEDDLELHIYYEHLPNRYKGYTYTRNADDSHRMVTHRDYSITVMYYDYIANALKASLGNPGLDIRDFKIQLAVRHSGYRRPLIYDNSRIFKMYKLDDDKIPQAMIGLNATLDIWKAENLENNAYTRLMRSEYADIDMALVQEAYGYNGMSKVVGDTPSKVQDLSGSAGVSLPFALINNATAYEYDENGYLLGYYYHNSGDTYVASNSNTKLVEVISGRGSYRPDIRHGTDNIPLPDSGNYRVYMCYLISGIPTDDWTDITGTAHYSVVNNTLIWNNLETDQFLMVRGDTEFLAYELDVHPVGGTFYFTLAEEADRGNGYLQRAMTVPMGDLDLFMNGKALIPNIDYYIQFPMVWIISKKHLIQPAHLTNQRVHVRFTGFCKSDMTMESVEDIGFVEHGFLSNNNRFDIRDDKVLRITVGGGTKHRDDVKFSEDHDGISVVNALNGSPYQIKDIVVPLTELADGETTYSLRAKSEIIDVDVSEYMTLMKPQPPRPVPSAFPQRYELVSPFICHITNDLHDNLVDPNFVNSNPNDSDLIAWCQQYEFMLQYDPINSDREVDSRCNVIYPHSSDQVFILTYNEYLLLKRIVKLYADGLVDISSFVAFNT